MPMECLLKARDLTTKADLFPLGVMLYEIIAGEQLNPARSGRAAKSLDDVRKESVSRSLVLSLILLLAYYHYQN